MPSSEVTTAHWNFTGALRAAGDPALRVRGRRRESAGYLRSRRLQTLKSVKRQTKQRAGPLKGQDRRRQKEKRGKDQALKRETISTDFQGMLKKVLQRAEHRQQEPGLQPRHVCSVNCTAKGISVSLEKQQTRYEQTCQGSIR